MLICWSLPRVCRHFPRLSFNDSRDKYIVLNSSIFWKLSLEGSEHFSDSAIKWPKCCQVSWGQSRICTPTWPAFTLCSEVLYFDETAKYFISCQAPACVFVSVHVCARLRESCQCSAGWGDYAAGRRVQRGRGGGCWKQGIVGPEMVFNLSESNSCFTENNPSWTSSSSSLSVPPPPTHTRTIYWLEPLYRIIYTYTLQVKPS